MGVAALFWIAGAFAHHEWRIALWAVAVACEYFSPMAGFAFPGLGRSGTHEWTIDGAHLAERCQLIVIVALGEMLLATGASFARAEAWDTGVVLAMLATFVGTIAMWWLYFGTSSERATQAIAASPDPGAMGARLHYVHAILVAGIIATAVGNDLVLERPLGHLDVTTIAVLVAGPAIYLLGSAAYKHVVYGRIPMSHLVGALAVAALVPVAFVSNLLVMGWLTSALIWVIGVCDMRSEGARTADAHA
jgi:low temperature requirement protein LtrA